MSLYKGTLFSLMKLTLCWRAAMASMYWGLKWSMGVQT